MSKPQVTLTEVTIHPPNDLLSAGALRLQLAPDGDFLILHQDSRHVEIDGADLPLLLEWGQRLLNQANNAPIDTTDTLDYHDDDPSLTAYERNPTLR